MVARLAASLLVLFGLSLATGARADDVATCDALAGEDLAIGPIMALDAIEPGPALAACLAALGQQPDNPRLIHQYARALERAGRIEDAQRLYGWAADDGYAPAVAAEARLAGAAPAPDATWTDAGRAELADAMAGLAGTLRRYASSLPPDPSDPLTVIAETGTDRAAILAWVTANTRLVPYVGSLRGPGGVLSDRSGNSLDRALALASLLSYAGDEVRIARATLSEADAAALLAETAQPVTLPALVPQSADQLAALLDDPRLGPDTGANVAAAILDRRAMIDRLVSDRTDAILPTLLAVAAPAQAAADATAHATALAALRDYFWVQVRSGVAWRDLVPDPALTAVPVPAETFDPAGVPDELRQTVTLRVIVELQDDAGRREEQLLSWTGAVTDLGGKVFTLSHEARGLDALDQVAALPDAPLRMLELIDRVSAWTPILRVNGDLVVDRLFTRDGAIEAANIAAFTAAGGAAGALFAEAADVLAGAETATARIATPSAEWLVIEINVPGAPPRVERRTLFDLIGPAARAAGTLAAVTDDVLRERAFSLIGTTEILIVGATPSDIQVALAAAGGVADIADAIRGVTAQAHPPTADDIPSAPPLGVPLLRFASARLAPGTSAAIASPNVFLSHDRVTWSPTGGASWQTEFDIVFNDIWSPADVFATRIRQGLVDTILEDAIAGDVTGRNASALHAADLAAGRLWAAVTPAALGAMAPDTRAQIEAELAAGGIVVAPQATAGTAWWRIDPATGTTLGMMPSGGGAAFAESAFLFYQGATTAACFVVITLSVRNAIGGQLTTGQAGVGILFCAGAITGGAGAGTAAATAGMVGGAGALTIIEALIIQAIMQ